MDKSIKVIIDKLGGCKEHLGTADLVNIGLFPSIQAIYQARIKKDTPPYIRIGRTTVYKKADILSYLETNYNLILKRINRSKRIVAKQQYNNSAYSMKLKQHLIGIVIKALKECDV